MQIEKLERYGQDVDFEEYPIGQCHIKPDGEFCLYSTTVKRENALIEALKEIAIRSVYDWPSDMPILCGYVCVICGQESSTGDEHTSECILQQIKETR